MAEGRQTPLMPRRRRECVAILAQVSTRFLWGLFLPLSIGGRHGVDLQLSLQSLRVLPSGA